VFYNSEGDSITDDKPYAYYQSLWFDGLDATADLVDYIVDKLRSGDTKIAGALVSEQPLELMHKIADALSADEPFSYLYNMPFSYIYDDDTLAASDTREAKTDDDNYPTQATQYFVIETQDVAVSEIGDE
jgi:hypothetical protein